MMLSSLKKEESSEKHVDQPQDTNEENLKLAEHLKKTLEAQSKADSVSIVSADLISVLEDLTDEKLW